jgi:hypothetical protein
MQIALFADRFAYQFEQREISWPDLCAYLTNPPEFPSKEACPLIKLAAYGGVVSPKGSLRHDANVLFVSGLEGDHDAGIIQPQDAAAMLQRAGIAGIIYTTASHRPDAPRWRALVPVSQNYQPTARWELAARLNHVFGGTLAAESFALSQAYYFGRVAGVPYEAHVSNGYYLDQLQLPALYPSTNPKANGGDFSLTDAPVPHWRGPADDDDLIRRALMSRSAAAAFGGRACFADLWNNNVEALALAYPPKKAGEAYDASQADMALIAHLCFWTGQHGERVLRLAKRSAMAREKWEREDYLPRTIAETIARGGDVLQDKPMEPAAVPQASGEAPKQSEVTGHTFLSPEAQRELFAGCVYVQDRHRALVPGGALLKPDQFRVAYGGYVFAMDAVNERTTRNAWEAFTESQVLRAPRADTVCFKPDQPPGAIINDAGRLRVNTYWPAQVKRASGDVGPFLAHLAKVLPDPRDQQIILAYMAAVVQHKGVKFPWCPVLQGVEGNGKTFFSACVAEAVGQHFTHWPMADDLASQFNGWIADKIFIALEELRGQEHTAEAVVEKLKTLITGGFGMQIQLKGVDQFSMQVCANFIATTNHKTAVRKTPDNARRFALFFTAQQTLADIQRDGMTGDYFPNLYAWARREGFAYITEYLHTYQIPAEFNPAGACHRAPHTSTTDLAMVESRGSVEQQIAEVIAQDTPGFMGGWVSSVMLDRLITDTLKMGGRLSHTKRKELLLGMGYILHPGLPDGRVNNPVQPDGRKPQLYILANHPERWLTGPAEIAKAYSAAQMLKPQ